MALTTLGVCVIDEIEWRKTYNDICNAANKLPEDDIKRIVLLIMQLFNAHDERIIEMQDQIEEDC